MEKTWYICLVITCRMTIVTNDEVGLSHWDVHKQGQAGDLQPQGPDNVAPALQQGKSQ